MNKMRMKSKDMQSYNIERLEKLFPEAVTEGKINFEKLRELLSGDISDDREVYDFTWVGKRKAMLESSTPINKTLRPCKEESKNWDSTENLYIEGDNLDVLKLLQESYLSSVKMIYIDPPYNTGNDFIYKDDFKQSADEYAEESGEYNEEGERLFKNTDTNGRFHSDWCSMIYSRLRIARNLLTDDGVIFISIDDNEVAQLRKICDEVFGEGNFVGAILWKKKTNGNNMGIIPPVHDYIITYAKNIGQVNNIGYEITKEFMEQTYSNPDNDHRGPWTTMDLSANHKGPYFAVTNHATGQIFYPPEGRYWVFNEQEILKRINEGRIIFGKSGTSRPVQKVFAKERVQGKIQAESWWDNHGQNEDATAELKELFGIPKLFIHPKPSVLLKHLVQITTDEGSIILDFFSGSATTAHAVMKLNAEDGGKRKFIMVQLPEKTDEKSEAYKAGYKTICEIGKERIRRAGDKILSELQKDKPAWADEEVTLDIGFRVFKTDSSNMKDVYYSAAEYDQTLLAALESNIKDDRDDLDLLFGCMLDWGLPLSIPYKSEKIGSFTIHTVNNGDLIACFNDEVSEEVVREIAKRTPLRALFRDSSFADSPSRINVGEIFKTLAPSTTVKVI